MALIFKSPGNNVINQKEENTLNLTWTKIAGPLRSKCKDFISFFIIIVVRIEGLIKGRMLVFWKSMALFLVSAYFLQKLVKFDDSFSGIVNVVFSDQKTEIFFYNSQKMYGVLCVVLLPLLLSQHTEAAAVISIDFGSEWMKIGIVSPGVPMEIVLNKESKRKTPAVVAFRDDVRTFGEDAVTVGVRFPKYSYKYLLDLLGKTYDHPLVQNYRLVAFYTHLRTAVKSFLCYLWTVPKYFTNKVKLH